MVNTNVKLNLGGPRKGAFNASWEFRKDFPETCKRASRVSQAQKGQEGAPGISVSNPELRNCPICSGNCRGSVLL